MLTRLVTFALLALTCLTPITAQAKSWCATPLYVHEWGVHVFNLGRSTGPSLLADFFHSPTNTQAFAPSVPVKSMPADGGERDLPLMHFYSARTNPVPVAIEVGFKHGDATRWWPDVDLFAPAGPIELTWQRLDLTPTPGPELGKVPAWGESARKIDGALWVNKGKLSDRFVFYEGRTREAVPLTLTRGDTWKPGRGHYVLVNTSAYPVRDVMFMHTAHGKTYLFVAPAIPAGASAGFLIEDHPVDAKTLPDRLRAMLQDLPVRTPQRPEPPPECVMQRDPATPFSAVAGHRLYGPEVDLILSVWQQRFFGTTQAVETKILYREDAAYLADVMPLSLYTDMYNFVVLNRASLALWEGVVLP